MAGVDPLRVEVAYAAAQVQEVIPVLVPAGTTLEQAINVSGILQRFPEISLASVTVGIFGEVARLEDIAQPGDRIEIYRPLQADPKQTRRRRAGAKRKPAG